MIVSFGICVILQNEIVLLDFTLKTLIGIVQVPTFKSRLKFTNISILIHLSLLIIVRIVISGMIERKNGT